MNELSLEGMEGEPIPYLLHSDWMVTCILFLCILVVSIVFSKNKKHLYQGIKNFTQNRERNSMFDEITASDARHTVLLVFHACLMLAFCAYYYIVNSCPLLFGQFTHGLVLFFLVLAISFCTFLKWATYQVVNWVFFQKERNILWITAFVNLLCCLGIVLLPIVLLIVYFNVSAQIAYILMGSLLIFMKMALFWKCFSNFFEKIYGFLHLILYFCALEILPDLILWKGMELLNNNLILNF